MYIAVFDRPQYKIIATFLMRMMTYRNVSLHDTRTAPACLSPMLSRRPRLARISEMWRGRGCQVHV